MKMNKPVKSDHVGFESLKRLSATKKMAFCAMMTPDEKPSDEKRLRVSSDKNFFIDTILRDKDNCNKDAEYGAYKPKARGVVIHRKSCRQYCV